MVKNKTSISQVNIFILLIPLDKLELMTEVSFFEYINYKIDRV